MGLRDQILNEKGYFLVTPLILAIILVLTILGFSLLLTTQQDLSSTWRRELEHKTLAVAEAGVNDYLWHLNQDEDYAQNEVHPAEGLDQSGDKKWVSLKDGEYHLEVTELTQTPGVLIEATGRVVKTTLEGTQTVERKIKARIQKRSFTRYLYFTENETLEGSDQKIWFVDGDVIHGPLHSNDYIHIWGDPVFEKKVTTNRQLDIHSGSHPAFEEGYEEEVPRLEIPPTNQDIKNWALLGGYYYYGYTEIKLLLSGQLNIDNENALSKGPTGIVALPSNGVIYVDGQEGSKWSANSGNAFIQGTLSGKLTIGTRNNIYITGDITYQNPEDDMLGLIAQNYVYINHFDQSFRDVAPYNIEINGAIFALNHSFGFEDYQYPPPKGTLLVKGSIAQRFRGAIGTFSSQRGKISGYTKDYYYDERMLYQEPPHFIAPLNAGFEIVSWEEIPP